MQTAKMVEKGRGRKSISVTVDTPSCVTVYTLADGTEVTPESVTVQRRKYTPRARACKVCGTQFKPESKTARYCSDACRAKAYRQRQVTEKGSRPREIVVEALTCAHCGQGFFAVKGRHAQFCS